MGFGDDEPINKEKIQRRSNDNKDAVPYNKIIAALAVYFDKFLPQHIMISFKKHIDKNLKLESDSIH